MEFAVGSLVDYGNAPEIAVGQIVRIVRISKGQVRITYGQPHHLPDGSCETRIVSHHIWDYENWIATALMVAKQISSIGTIPVAAAGHQSDCVAH